jgi:N-acetylglucosaminyl-diphospho-decaprenol L-rhamnosyltransferase
LPPLDRLNGPSTPAVPADAAETPQGPRVSAILVAYRQSAALRRAIEALERSQGRERLEILVADCGSQDDTSRIDAEFPSVTMLRLPHHLGSGRAMNIASRTAKADLLLFLSPNLEVAPETASALADRLDADESATAAAPMLADPQGAPALVAGKLPTRETFAAVCRGEPYPRAAIDASAQSVAVEYAGLEALMVRKQFVRGMNYFDERYGHYWPEADLAMQIRRAGKKIRVYPGVQALLHPAADPLAGDALAAADKISGAAAFLGKYEGFFAGLSFRLSAALRALGRFDLGQVGAVLGGSKLDGSQAG